MTVDARNRTARTHEIGASAISAAPAREAAQTRPCEHGWMVESSHATSEGRVLYVRCAGCGARRLDLQIDDLQVEALSRALPQP